MSVNGLRYALAAGAFMPSVFPGLHPPSTTCPVPPAGSDSDDEDRPTVQGPSKEDVYSAYHKGTTSSKKKKQKKLKRVQVSP